MFNLKEKELSEITANFAEKSQKLEIDNNILKTKLLEYERKNNDFQKKFEELDSKLINSTNELEKSSNKLTDLQKKLNLAENSNEKVIEYQQKLESLENILKISERKTSHLEGNNEELTKKLEFYEVKTAEIEGINVELQKRVENSDKRFMENNGKAIELQKKLDAVEDELKEFHKKTKECDYERKIEDIQKKMDISEFSAFNLRKENEHFKQNLLKIENTYLNELDDLKKTYSEDLIKYVNFNKSLNETYRQKVEDFDGLAQKYQDSKEENEKLEKEMHKLYQNIEGYKEKIRKLEEELLDSRGKEFYKQEEMEARIRSLLMELDELKLINTTLSMELETKKKYLYKSGEFEVSELKSEIFDLKDKLRDFRRKFQRGEEELSDLKGQNVDLKERLKQMREDKAAPSEDRFRENRENYKKNTSFIEKWGGDFDNKENWKDDREMEEMMENYKKYSTVRKYL